MGPPRDKAGKGKSAASRNLNFPTTIDQTPTSGLPRPTTTPATTHGKSTADAATAIDTTATTLVFSNASNVQTTPCIPVKRPHEGSVVPNFRRTKASDQAIAVTLLKVDGQPDDKPESAKAKSEQAKDDESDEIERLFAAYRPVDGISGAGQSSTNPFPRGLNPVGLNMASTSLNTASEDSMKTASTFNTASVDNTATAHKALASIEDSTSMSVGPSATAANPNTTSAPPTSFFIAPNSSPTMRLPLFGVSGTLGRPEQKYIDSGASTPLIDFGTAPTPNPATTRPFDVLKVDETSSTPNTAPASQSSVLSMLHTVPTPNSTTESPFSRLKMADKTPKTNLATESPFGMPNMASTGPKSNLTTPTAFSSSEALRTSPVPNPATTSPFGLFKLPQTAPAPNPAITGQFGVYDTASTHIPATTSPFGVFKMIENAPTPNTTTTNPFGAFKMDENAPKPNLATKSPFGMFNSEQARQSKSNSFGFGPTGSSSSLFTTSKATGSNTGNGDSLATYTPAIFNESKLVPIQPDVGSKMAIAEGLSYTYQPMVPLSHFQPKDYSRSNPFKSLQTDNALPSANFTGNSTTQQNNQFGGSPFTQTTNKITFQNPQNLIIYQKDVIQELRSSKAWLSYQNEIVSRNLAISTENLGLCGAQLQYFSTRCNDLNELCKERREEIAKLQDELDKVNETCEAEKEKANLALELLKKEKYKILSRCAHCVCVLVCTLIIWLGIKFYERIF